MPALIDETKGFAAIAYRGEIPWHGMGQIIEPGDDLITICVKGGLDWSALVIPAQYEFEGRLRIAPNAFHMVRSDTGESLSVMSKRFKPHQPADVIAFYRDFVLLDPRFQIETCGALKSGRVIWCLARFESPLTVVGDRHDAYVLLTTSFDGTIATRAVATMKRVVCNNTLNGALWAAKLEQAYVRVTHSADFGDPDVRANAADRFSAVIAQFGQYKAMGEALAHVRMSAAEIEALFKRLTTDKAAEAAAGDKDAPSGRARAALERLLSSYRDTLAEGTERNTGWAALNAVTRYVDHNRTVRDTFGEGHSAAQFHSANFGSGAALKRNAIQAICEVGEITMEDIFAMAPRNDTRGVSLESVLDATGA